MNRRFKMAGRRPAPLGFAAMAVVAVCMLASCVKQRPTPDFALKDSTGQTVQLSDYHGKVVLLNFWATWCGPCKIEIPWFVEFQNKYKDRGLAVLGVSMDEDGWQTVRPFIAAQNVNYRVAIGTDQVARRYGGIASLPTTFIIDQEGKIAAVHIGLVSKTNYASEILHLLA